MADIDSGPSSPIEEAANISESSDVAELSDNEGHVEHGMHSKSRL